MDYIALIKILTEWSMKNKEYQLVNFLFSEFYIGIPVNLLYSLLIFSLDKFIV